MQPCIFSKELGQVAVPGDFSHLSIARKHSAKKGSGVLAIPRELAGLENGSRINITHLLLGCAAMDRNGRRRPLSKSAVHQLG